MERLFEFGLRMGLGEAFSAIPDFQRSHEAPAMISSTDEIISRTTALQRELRSVRGDRNIQAKEKVRLADEINGDIGFMVLQALSLRKFQESNLLVNFRTGPSPMQPFNGFKLTIVMPDHEDYEFSALVYDVARHFNGRIDMVINLMGKPDSILEETKKERASRISRELETMRFRSRQYPKEKPVIDESRMIVVENALELIAQGELDATIEKPDETLPNMPGGAMFIKFSENKASLFFPEKIPDFDNLLRAIEDSRSPKASQV
jgi:hypothetical protein